MERFGEVSDQYDPSVVEDRVLDYWDEVDAYEKTREHRSDGEPYFFVDGPPYTSGSAHMGHAWNKTLKDVYVRYKSMQGYDVTDRPGYDMHGLPIETRVEEELDFENKKDIEEYGVDAFLDACREFAEDSLQGLQEDFQSFGVWMDWDDPYKTVAPEYMEAAWWAFSRANERGLVERGQRSISQCPRCETAIANNEVEYEDVEDPSIYVKFDLKEREGSLVIWTTTPWTLPANTFVAVDPDLTYQRVRAEKGGETEDLWLAEPCVEDVLSTGRYGEYEVVEELTGEEMTGWEYEHPFADEAEAAPDEEAARRVYTADYVEADRTGLVHSAPGHGEEDFHRGQELGLDIVCPVGPDGVFDERAGPFAGQFVRDANSDIVAALEEKGLMLSAGTTEHSYGHCWRCDTGVVQLVTDQWLVTVTDVKEQLLDNVGDSEWYPRSARDGRFRKFVEGSPDWNVSRQRYWGIPIPIWLPDGEATASNGDSAERSSADHSSGQSPREDGEAADSDGWSGDMDDAVVVADREELAERVDQDVDSDEVDLHKDTVDDLTITEDGTTYRRVPDVFDVWLDSSVATWGTLNYPSEDDRFGELWPADLIVEAHDQTRGWFWSQLGMGTATGEGTPYERVMMHGHALMPDGRAMSKSKDIRIDPGEVTEEYGTDPMRAFLLSLTARGEDMNFSYEETREMGRRLNILWNVFRFPLPYMRMDGFSPDETTVEDVALETADEWVLSRLQTVEATATEAMEEFRQDEALNAVLEFVVGDVSRYYVQLVRERMWEEDDSESKQAAYATLYRVLRETVALLAPFVPFVTEEIYGTLTGDREHPTVHMCDWPEPDEALRNPAMEAEFDVVRSVETAGSSARQQAGRKLRWPVPRIVVDAPTGAVADAVEARRELLADRLNARSVELYGPGEEWRELRYAAQADMGELGPAFGDDAGRVMNALNDAALEERSVAAASAAVGEATDLDVDLDESMIDGWEEVLPENVANDEFTVDGDDPTVGTVYADVTLTEDIEREGYAREVVRRVQEMRKDLELDVDAEIRLELDVDDDRVAEMVRDREAFVAEEVRAGELGSVEDGHRKEWDVEGVTVRLAVEPLAETAA